MIYFSSEKNVYQHRDRVFTDRETDRSSYSLMVARRTLWTLGDEKFSQICLKRQKEQFQAREKIRKKFWRLCDLKFLWNRRFNSNVGKSLSASRDSSKYDFFLWRHNQKVDGIISEPYCVVFNVQLTRFPSRWGRAIKNIVEKFCVGDSLLKTMNYPMNFIRNAF